MVEYMTSESIEQTARRVIHLWRTRSHLAVSDRSENWVNICAWMDEMRQAIDKLEQEVLHAGDTVQD